MGDIDDIKQGIPGEIINIDIEGTEDTLPIKGTFIWVEETSCPDDGGTIIEPINETWVKQ